MNGPAAAPALDTRRRPTFGVLRLAAAAAFDLILLPPRALASIVCSRRWRAQTERLIRSRALNAPQDPHPAR